MVSTRTGAKVPRYRRVVISDRWYYEKLDLKPHEKYLLAILLELPSDIDSLKKYIEAGNIREATLTALQIGMHQTLVSLLPCDLYVKNWKSIMDRLGKGRMSAAKEIRKKRKSLWEQIITLNKDKEKRGVPPNARYRQIQDEMRSRGTPVSRSTILRTIRRSAK